MEPSGSNIKKLLTFSRISGNRSPYKIPYISGSGNPKNLLIFQEATFQAQKIKKSTWRKFLTSQETDTGKILLTFSQKKAVFLFRKRKPLKNYLYFRKRKA